MLVKLGARLLVRGCRRESAASAPSTRLLGLLLLVYVVQEGFLLLMYRDRVPVTGEGERMVPGTEVGRGVLVTSEVG